MEKFLDFLASNYIYFLIAAGVLFFALIGFIVDLKKKNKTEEDTGEVAPEVPMEAQVPIAPVTPVAPVAPVAQVVSMDEFNPNIVAPEVEPEIIDLGPVPPVQPQVQQTVQETPRVEIEELK